MKIHNNDFKRKTEWVLVRVPKRELRNFTRNLHQAISPIFIRHPRFLFLALPFCYFGALFSALRTSRKNELCAWHQLGYNSIPGNTAN